MPSRTFPSVAAVRTMVSPRRTTTAPSACLASLPVSRLRVDAPSAHSTRVTCTELSSLRLRQESSHRPLRGLPTADCRSKIVETAARWGPSNLRPAVTRRRLLPEPQLLDQCQVAGAVRVLQVLEQVGPLADHLEQAAAGGVVLRVGPHVLREAVDPLGQERDLDLGRAAVVVGALVRGNEFGLAFLRDRHGRLCSLRLVSRLLPRWPNRYFGFVGSVSEHCGKAGAERQGGGPILPSPGVPAALERPDGVLLLRDLNRPGPQVADLLDGLAGRQPA